MHIVIFEGILIAVLLMSYFLGKRYHKSRQLLLLLYIVTMSVYIVWRAGWTLPTNNALSIFFGILLLAAEVGGFVLSLVFYRVFLRKYKRAAEPLSLFKGEYPSVDIMIATYNEGKEILKRGIVAATLAYYPKPELVNIYVCDDGDRPEVEQLCQELGVHYVSRLTHEHAKAGNLNHAMTVSQGELVVTMDADMVMREDFLALTVGYFHDPKMGFMQAPQTFFNEDPYQFNLFASDTIGNDQDFFMRSIEAQKDAFNAVMYVGSNAIFRREALNSIGGFSTGVITEDMATGMFLQAKGWRSGFVNENLASGLAPETFGDLIKQRDRWARGNIQVAKKWNPWRLEGLSLVQRILYADGIHYWFSGIYKMIFLLAPILFLVFGQYSLQTDMYQILIFWLPAFIASQLAFNLVSEKKQTVMLSNIYEVATAPFMAYAVFNELFLKSKKGFAVTRKGVNSDASFYNWATAWPVLVLLVLSIIGLVRGIGFVSGYWPSPYPVQGIYINIFWLLYNLVSLILAAYLSNERPRLRQSERFESQHAIQIELPDHTMLSGHLLDWNENGARMKLMGDFSQNTHIDNSTLIIDNVKMNFENQWQKPVDDGLLLGVTFKALDLQAYAFIIRHTYGQPSSQIVSAQRNNSIWHILAVWWFNTLKRREAYQKKTDA